MRLKSILAQMAEVGTEYMVCFRAIGRLRLEMIQNPALGPKIKLTNAAVKRALTHLESTFVVRAFAMFEAALRELWSAAFDRKTEPPVRVLVDAIASAVKHIPHGFIKDVHAIRQFRNSIVHLNLLAPRNYSLVQTVHALRAYLSLMPREW
ncbi:MAG TPA: hypothetical protein VGN88_09845 [Phycisphaerae bacterium]|jgi:hypothetical protein